MVLASTIAIVESSASDRHRYRQYLNADRLLAVGSSGEGLELCARHQPEAIVLGDSIGDALEFLDRLQTTISPPPAVVFVVSRSREALAARAFKAGARDYLIREEITPETLRESIETAIAAGRPKIECDRVEAKLQVQEERFRSSVETMLDCFGIYTAMRDGHGQIVDFRIDYVNDAACLNNSITAQEQIGRGLCEILPAHRDAGLFDAYCQVVETGQPFIKENIVYDDNYGQQRLARAFDIRVAKFGDGFVSTWRDISDRKQIEETLRKRETELRLVTDAVPALISFVDTDRRYRFANRGYENWFGRSAEAIEGKHLREVLGEPAYQEIRPWVDRVLAGEQVSFETQIPYRNGGSRYVKATYVPQFGKTGNVQGFVALVEDISDRKCAEAALRESEERFRTLAENISQFTWMADPTGWIFWYNQRWYDYTGTTLEQMQGWGWQQIHHPDYVDGVVEGFRHCIEAGEPWEDTFPLRGTDGTYRWFLSRALPIRDAQGDISRWFGTNTDITALKEAEEAIATSEERFRLAADGAHTGTWDIDLTTGEAVWSPRHFTILGYEPDPNGAASEQMWHDRLHPEDVDRVTREWQQARQERRRYRAEYRIIRADNQQVSWVVALGSFTYNRHGEAIRSTGVVLDINPRKQAEAALVRQERRYRHIFEAVGVSIWEEDFSQVKAAINELKAAGVDDIGEYCRSHPEFVRDAIAMVGLRDVNQASLYLFGAQTKEELLHSLDRIFTPETEETFIEELAAIAAGETRFAAETIVRTLRGDRLHILFSIAFPPPDEPYDRVLVSMFDISDRVAAEAALRESESRFREMADAAPMLIWMSGTDKLGIYFNASWLTFTGRTMAQELGDGWTQGIHPDDRDRALETYRTAFDARRPFEIEYRLRNASGDYRWIFDAGTPRFTPNGKFLGYVGSCFDIHQRKRTERALRRSEDRLRMTIEAARLGTWDWNLRTNVLIWDAGCKAMFGLSSEASNSIEVFFEGLHPDDRDRIDRVVRAALDPASDGRYEAEYRTIGIEDGIERWISAKGKAYFDTDGTPQRFIGTVLDISDRKQAEAERERLLESERSAREEAERANRVKDEFLAILSHELRSPLNPILGWSKLLQIRDFNREQIVSAAATIERNVKLQTQLVDDLLDLARILRGKLSLDPAPFNLTQVVEAAMETVKTAAVSKAIALQSTLPEVGQVFGDSARLQQVVWNLLSNAIKFTPKGGQVTVDLEEMDDRVRILVRDTGKGIKREFLPYLFEAFRQESSATTRQHGGLGLGLAIVYQLVEAHGGTIWADSPGEGMGATFTVELPLFDTATNCDRSGGLHDQNIDLSGIRILAVDDSSDTCELLKILLSEYGVEVTAATSAAEAIATFETLQPDVLISDIGMPEVDGYTLIQQIRALAPEKGGNIPAIALTAYAREDDRDRAIEWGYQCHIPKPLDPDRLVEAIVELIHP